ncbi:MAG: TetR/AcrR family transcriptional regulator [Anaerolineae bacterium]|nr:TetR/AcrR family transcriptional regulator [Anaerolineae bacterium]
MPYPSKLDSETLASAAFDMIEQGGVDDFSMHKLAAEFGVKTASLYRYFNKEALIQAVNTLTYHSLLRAMYEAVSAEGDPAQRLLLGTKAMAAYAHQHPVTYMLAFRNTDDALRPAEGATEQAVLPLQAIIAEISGEADSLAALRGLQALAHGFISLTLAGQYRRGGDLDAHFEQAVVAYLRGWQR